MSKKQKTKNRRFDRRAMEVTTAKIDRLMIGQNFSSLEEANKFLMEHASGLKLNDVEYIATTPLEQAQLIMWEAFDEPSRKKRIAMAEKALEVCADCADAYVLLAEDQSRDESEEIELYRKGVEAGKRALGDEVLKDPATQFWSDLKTRPYMRAMSGLGCALHGAGQFDEAITVWKEVFLLNQNDNQGVRHLLVPTLVETNRLAEAEELLNEFAEERSPHMLYSRALCLFKKHGDSRIAAEALDAAIRGNHHVFEYMLGAREMPKKQESSFSPGSPEEAHAYMSLATQSWINAEGALRWIAEYTRREVQKIRLSKTFPGIPLDEPKKNLIDLGSFRHR